MNFVKVGVLCSFTEKGRKVSTKKMISKGEKVIICKEVLVVKVKS
jgi:archaeosine-15-forming tRNA-guanine transglycosylase